MTGTALSDEAHPRKEHRGAEHLIKMANDIGHFFRAEPDREDAIAGIANHIAKYWTKPMREKLTAHLNSDSDTDLEDLPREAMQRLAAHPVALAKEPAGGDAG